MRAQGRGAQGSPQDPGAGVAICRREGEGLAQDVGQPRAHLRHRGEGCEAETDRHTRVAAGEAGHPGAHEGLVEDARH